MSAPPARAVLERGDVEVHGRIAGSSNATLLVSCRLDGAELLAVYKPVAGERELWDFAPGLDRREVAAHLLSEALGWELVPETVQRDDAPFGRGSFQRVVDEDGVSHYFTLRDEARWQADLRRIAAFDVVANNADRKSGHVLLAEDRLWAIDHGLTFHVEPKLRTVIWDFAGEPLDHTLVEDLARFAAAPLPADLAALLGDDEREALLARTRALLDDGVLPTPGPEHHRPYPWPLV